MVWDGGSHLHEGRGDEMLRPQDARPAGDARSGTDENAVVGILGGTSGGGASGPALPSPLQGTILKVAVEKGADVEEGALVCVIEAMKMENEITAHRAGKVSELNVTEGTAINAGDQICVIE